MKEIKLKAKSNFILCSIVLIGIITNISCSSDEQKPIQNAPKKEVAEIKKNIPPTAETPKPAKKKLAGSKESINYKNVNIDLLAELIHLEINRVRNALGLKVLNINKTLKNAATDHNNYLVGVGDLSHEQKDKNKRHPKDRVQLYGGGFKALAENVIYEGFTIRTSSDGSKKIITPTYEEMAAKIVRSWMGSPGHRKNIVNPVYDEVGTGVGYHGSLHAVFATQVFGTRS